MVLPPIALTSSAATKIESESSSLLLFVREQNEQARVDHAENEP